MAGKYLNCPHCEKRVYYSETKFAIEGRKGGLASGDSKRRGNADHYKKMAEARWKKEKANS